MIHGRTITFTKESETNPLVRIELEGTEISNSHSFPIHVNAAIGGRGNAIMALNDVTGATGISKTIVSKMGDNTPFNYGEVLDFDGHANVHSSSTTKSTLISQGNIGSNVQTMNTNTPKTKITMTIKNYLFATLLVIISYTFSSCSSDNEDDLLPKDERCGEQAATLSGDIIPIINQNCAVSGCHVSGTSRVNFTIEENIISRANTIRSYTESSFMPPSASGKQLSDKEKDLIFCWVDQGALDN